MARVFISGGYFHEEDLDYLSGGGEIKFIPNPISLGAFGDVDSFFEQASSADLALFLTHGGKLKKFFDLHGDKPRVREFFANKSIRKIMWTVDAHHLWPLEQKYQEYFDAVYVADSSVMKHFDQDKVRWLPCYFRYLSIRDLLKLTEKRPPQERNLIFAYHNYQMGDRNELARRIKKICDQKPLESLFGNVGSEEAYKSAMLGSQICLNITLASEVNLRAFEAMAYNCVHLADAAQDYNRIQADWSRTVFFRRDLSDFEKRLDQALKIEPDPGPVHAIVNHHMVLHRYIEVINRELGTQCRMSEAVSPGNFGYPSHFGHKF